MENDEAPAPRRSSPAKFARPLAELAAFYQCSPRGLKKWIAAGRRHDPPEVPPLDEPAAMPGWWAKCMKIRVPSLLVDLAAGAAKAPDVQSQETVSSGSADLFAQATTAAAPAGDALEQLRQATARASAAYEAEAAKPVLDEARLRLLKREWLELHEALRKSGGAGLEALISSGELLPRADVEKEWSELHRTLLQSLRAMWRRLRPKLQGLDERLQDGEVQAELDRLFESLKASRFAAAVT